MAHEPRRPAFLTDCIRRIAAGEQLTDDEARVFSDYLDARERTGQRLLGSLAGEDAPVDTVSGRCGLRPAFRDLD